MRDSAGRDQISHIHAVDSELSSEALLTGCKVQYGP